MISVAFIFFFQSEANGVYCVHNWFLLAFLLVFSLFSWNSWKSFCDIVVMQQQWKHKIESIEVDPKSRNINEKFHFHCSKSRTFVVRNGFCDPVCLIEFGLFFNEVDISTFASCMHFRIISADHKCSKNKSLD